MGEIAELSSGVLLKYGIYINNYGVPGIIYTFYELLFILLL